MIDSYSIRARTEARATPSGATFFAGCFTLSGLLFVLYPAIRPFSSEVGLDGAQAFASSGWILAHSLGILGFILLGLGTFGLYLRLEGTPLAKRMLTALVTVWLGVGLTIPYYGAEVFGLHAVGQRVVSQNNPALLEPLTHDIRWEAGIYFILLGLLLLAVGAILTARVVWRSGAVQPVERRPARRRTRALHPAVHRTAVGASRARPPDARGLRLARLGADEDPADGEDAVMTTSERINLLLRVTMETGVVAALGFWGYHAGGSTAARIGLMVAAPALGFGLWGAVDFHQAGRLGEPLRLVQELTISALAAVAWYVAGHHGLGIALGALSLAYHLLVYATGGRLLTPARGVRHVDRSSGRASPGPRMRLVSGSTARGSTASARPAGSVRRARRRV